MPTQRKQSSSLLPGGVGGGGGGCVQLREGGWAWSEKASWKELQWFGQGGEEGAVEKRGVEALPVLLLVKKEGGMPRHLYRRFL